MVPPSQLRAPEVAFGGGVRAATLRDEVEPLTADLRRLHITVDAQFLKMLATARDGLSHTIPGASMEQVLKAALELLLENQAKARGLVKRPRKVLEVAIPTPTPTTTAGAAAATAAPMPALASSPPSPAQPLGLFPTEPPLHRRSGSRQAIPSAVKRAVWKRDGGRCSWPLDSGGVCGSTHALEFDHIIPWARWGGETAADLRVVCRAHNTLAARQAFGDRCVARYDRSRRDAKRPGGS